MATTIKSQAVIFINGKQVENTFSDIKKATKKLRGELKKLPVGTEKFQKKAAELRKAEVHFARVKKEVKQTNKALKNSGSVWSRFFGMIGGFGGFRQIITAFSAGALVGKLLDIADAITNVEKTSGLATEQVGELWHEFSELDTRTSKLKLLKIAEIGGRLGIQSKEALKGFTEAIDKAYVALGDTFQGGLEAVTNQLGKLKNLFTETADMGYPEAINRIGSSLNELAANGTASEQNIAEFASRVGQLPDALKPSISSTLGLGAAFEESGLDAEKSASGYSRFMSSAAGNIEAFAYSMNMGVDEAKKLLNTHPEEFFIRFSEGMVGLDATQTANIFKDLKLNTLEIKKSVGAAGKNANRFREMMRLSAKSISEATSLTDEFNKKNNNSAAVWTKVWKGIKDFVTDGAIPEGFDAISKWVGKITGVTSEAGNGMVVFRERLFALFKIISVGVTAFISLKAAIWLSSIATKRATLQNILFRNSIVANSFAVKIYKGVMLLLQYAYARVTGNTLRANAAMRLFNTTVKANPIMFLVGVLITAGTALYMFWDKTKKSTKALSEQEQKAKAVADAHKMMAEESTKSISKYKTAVDPLIALLKDQNTTLDMRKRAYNALVEMYPEFKGAVDDEFRATGDLAKVYDTLAKKIKEAAIARGMQKAYQKAADDFAAAQVEVYNKKLAKDKEDKENESIKAYNESVREGAKYIPANRGLSASFAQGSVKTLKTKANNEYEIALNKQKEAEAHLNAITGLRQEKVNALNKEVKDLETLIAEKQTALQNTKLSKDKEKLKAEIAELEAQKKEKEDKVLTIGGVSNAGSDVVTNRLGGVNSKDPNRELNEQLKKAMKERYESEKSAREARWKLREEELSRLKDSHEKEIELLDLQREQKVAKITEETEKIKAQIFEQQNQIDALKSARKDAKTPEQVAEIDNSIVQLQKSIASKNSLIETNNKRLAFLEESYQKEKKAIREKWELEGQLKSVKAEKQRIDTLKKQREDEILDIKTLEEAKARIRQNTYKTLSEEELSNLKSLEEAKKVLRENANREVLEASLNALKAQREILKEVLKGMSGEAADKLMADLVVLDDKIRELRAKMQGKQAEDEGTESSGDDGAGQVDVLGFSYNQWEETFKNLDTTASKIQAVGMVMTALSNIASMYAQHQKVLNDKELAEFTKNQERKKKALDNQLNAGIISQEQYQKKTEALKEKADAKRRELAIKQAKAEKRAKIFSIIGSTATGIAKALELGFPASLIVGAIHAAIGAAQLSMVMNQPLPSFHKGGYTGGLGFKDKTGHEVAGAVHKNEYVIPEWLLKQPEVANVAGWLEAKRQGKPEGFSEGGYTNTTQKEIEGEDTSTPNKDKETTIALIQMLHRLDIVLTDLEKNGVEAFVISDAKNGREMEKAIRSYRTIDLKNKH